MYRRDIKKFLDDRLKEDPEQCVECDCRHECIGASGGVNGVYWCTRMDPDWRLKFGSEHVEDVVVVSRKRRTKCDATLDIFGGEE